MRNVLYVVWSGAVLAIEVVLVLAGLSLSLAAAGCGVEDDLAPPHELCATEQCGTLDAGVADRQLASGYCLPTPPPMPMPGAGEPAADFPDEFAICLYEPERLALAEYVRGLHTWSAQVYAAHGCE